jgi:hypothetical protein
LNLQYFIFQFKGNLLFKLQKKQFQRLKQKKWLIHFNGAPAANKIQGRQSADSQSRLAAIEPTAGISLLLHLKQISSGMPISAVSQ